MTKKDGYSLISWVMNVIEIPMVEPCVASYSVRCILCSCVTIDTFLQFSLGGIPHLPYVI